MPALHPFALLVALLAIACAGAQPRADERSSPPTSEPTPAPSTTTAAPAPAGCPLATGLLPPTCRAIAVRGAIGSRSGSGGERSAIDGDTCTMWSSEGPPPAHLDLAFEQAAAVDGVLLVPAMTPTTGDVLHRIDVLDPVAGPAAGVQATMTDDTPYLAVFSAPVEATRLRVVSLSSPSWIAWRELVPFTCETHPPPNTVAPPSAEPPDGVPLPTPES